MVLKVTIEIPKHSNIKYEYNRFDQKWYVDRILYGAEVYPQNYGFLADALDYDGDELDVLVIANQPLMCGVIVKTRIIGALEMLDENETDTKLIGVIDCDPRWNEVTSIKNVPNHLLKEIKAFFENYKKLQNKKVVVNQFCDIEWAQKEYLTCKALMTQYGHLKKADFIKQMKKLYPKKYKE